MGRDQPDLSYDRRRLIDGDERIYGDEFHPRDTVLALGLNLTAMAGWALIYRLVFRNMRRPKSLLSGASMALLAYVVDYHVVPKRFTPGVEKKLSHNAIPALYAALAAGFAALQEH